MSWFRHRPKVKEHSRMTPHRTSPITDKLLREIKEEVRKPAKTSDTTHPENK